ncbi:MAG: carbohydrate porin [Gammaproteobacteria bacterium]
MMIKISTWLLTLSLNTLYAPALAQSVQTRAGYEADPGFAGPSATTSQLAEDDAPKEPALRFPAFDSTLQPWFDWKRGLNEDYGLQLGVAYTSLYQAASDVLVGAEDDAGSGIFRLSGRWKLLNRGSNNTGALVFSLDHRHRYTDLTPSDLGFAAGYLGIPGTLFSDINLVLGDLNWQQSFNDGQSGLVVGRYDPNDFFDVLGYANPWTSFQNLAILFNPSIALADWSTGIGISHWLDEQWYLKAAVNDVNGTATDVQLFEDLDELYTTAEIGWSPSREERYFKNLHITYWHADEREQAGVEESDGIAIGANWTFDDTWMIFTRLGWSDGSAPLYNSSVTAGMLYYVAARSDLLGLAFNWGEPGGGVAGDSPSEQLSGELFYRLQLAENLAITPSVQWFKDPALNPDEDNIWLASLRLRVSF